MKCLFCHEPIQEDDEIADVLLGEAEKTSDGQLEELSYSGEIDTGHRHCLEKARDQFQRKGGA